MKVAQGVSGEQPSLGQRPRHVLASSAGAQCRFSTLFALFMQLLCASAVPAHLHGSRQRGPGHKWLQRRLAHSITLRAHRCCEARVTIPSTRNGTPGMMGNNTPSSPAARHSHPKIMRQIDRGCGLSSEISIAPHPASETNLLAASRFLSALPYGRAPRLAGVPRRPAF